MLPLEPVASNIIKGFVDLGAAEKFIQYFPCGTGSQVFWPKEKGFEILSNDISRSMLKIAKKSEAKAVKN